MPDPRLERLDIEGFTSMVEATLSIGDLNVLVGANGAGKSNLIRTFEFLGRVVDEDMRVHVSRSGGASTLLNVDPEVRAIRLRLHGHSGSAEIAYDAFLAPGADDDLFFVNEQVSYHRASEYAKPWTASLDNGHRETRLHATIDARSRGQAVASAVVDLLRGCRVYHFHDTSSSAPVKQRSALADNLTLSPDGGNLASVLRRLQTSEDPADQAALRLIVGSIRQVAPFFRDFVLEPEGRDQVRLRWRQQRADAILSAHQMSDGTLRFICLAVLLLQPRRPAMVVLDEPELGLHPYAIVALAGLLRQATTGSQVVIATQSVTLMNQFDLADLVVVEGGDRGSTFTRPDPGELGTWLEEYSLGELWEKNVLGGRPGSTRGPAGD